MAGGVDDVQALAVPDGGGGSGRNRNAALLLLLHEIHGGSAVMHFADLVALAGIKKNALSHSRLAGINVGHDAEVPVVCKFVCAGHNLVCPELPAVMAESAVRFGHLVGVFPLLHG